MAEVWFLLMIVSAAPLTTPSVAQFTGFADQASCERARKQVVEKLRIKNAACVVMEVGPKPAPVDHDH